MTATYRNPIRGDLPLDLDEAIRLLRKVTEAYGEVLTDLYEYDADHPEIWATCSEHPAGGCGYRDMPAFFIHACVTECDVRDAEAFLKAWDNQ